MKSKRSTLCFVVEIIGTTSNVRNRLNERFGVDTAKAISPGLIELRVPAKYKGQQIKFTSIVKAMYFEDKPENVEERINTFVRELVVSQDKHNSEIALEAIGNAGVKKLSVLLSRPMSRCVCEQPDVCSI